MFYLKFEKHTIQEYNRVSNIYITVDSVISTTEQNRVIRLNESNLNNKYKLYTAR